MIRLHWLVVIAMIEVRWCVRNGRHKERSCETLEFDENDP
jgi:hypothetical protein